MKLFIAQLVAETNTFSRQTTGWKAFEEYGIFRGNASERDPDGAGLILNEWRRLAEDDRHEVVESVSAYAQPAGRVERPVYEALRDSILEDLAAAGRIDAVLLMLHGAMAAEGYDDCEGDLTSRVREIVGPVVAIGLELDLHCHFTRSMRQSADIVVAFKEYPHTDLIERARDVYALTMGAAKKEIRPATAVYECRMVGLWHTMREPMLSFVQRLKKLEGHDGVLSISFGHGFPWGDVPEAGAKIWVITDNEPEVAAALAKKLGQELWAIREEIKFGSSDVDEAIDRSFATDDGPMVFADIADNPGGGASGDSTFILRRLLDRQVGNFTVGAFWDVDAIGDCIEAGIGAAINLRIGGKCGPTSGIPVDLDVVVRNIQRDHFQDGLSGKAPMGTAVWVEAQNGVDILLASIRGQIYMPNAFTGMGMELERKKLIVVKSMQHFHAGFAPLARRIFYVNTPGPINMDFASIPYKNRDLDFWPRSPNPFRVDRQARGEFAMETAGVPPAKRYGFDDVDAVRDDRFFIAYLDKARELPALQQIERLIADRLASEGASRIVEIGCGTGGLLSSLIQPFGRGLGVEKSLSFAVEARRRHGHQENIAFVVHDFSNAPATEEFAKAGFPPRSADTLILNRVIQHIAEPRRLLDNAVDLLRPGALIVLSDVDWTRLEVAHPDQDITRRIVSEHVAAMVNPNAGANLCELLGNYGSCAPEDVADVRNDITDFDLAADTFSLKRALARLVDRGEVTELNAARWTAECQEMTVAGKFLASLFHSVAAVRK